MFNLRAPYQKLYNSRKMELQAAQWKHFQDARRRLLSMITLRKRLRE